MNPRLACLLLYVLVLALAACAGAAPASDSEGVLRGSVSYRERIALPPEATVEVWIVDVSPGNMIMAIVAQTQIATEGRQVPIRFELRYPRQRVLADRHYAVRAAIHGGGRMMFASSEGQRVITQGHPSEVSLLLASQGGAVSGAAPDRSTLAD